MIIASCPVVCGVGNAVELVEAGVVFGRRHGLDGADQVVELDHEKPRFSGQLAGRPALADT
ncbi:hypothetical protein ACFU8Q_03355 [Streptomyces sp. NPDC057543]|uniref:hypothetical protein n=1 Tax=Streptomyces sp. NPDC057543 TaxID=3346163 RepID=UPI0036900198